jgi:tRNA threonylcarbamoyl adenosine modification protein (Sua5/YciO/YrdC/YwlC family)
VFIRIHPENPEERKILQIVQALKEGAIIIYPTDTVYGIGCDILNTKAIERLYKIKGVNEKTARFSFVCNDISDFSKYAKSFDNSVFRDIKRSLPGPFTFILEASKEVPKLLKTKKNSVGLRIPNNKICQAIVAGLGNPIISTSLPDSLDVDDYADPEIFATNYEHLVDFIVDGGVGNIEASTVIDYTGGSPVLIRQGAGEIDLFNL